ncbi:MAG: type II secretion system protein GspL [Myxococcales bacterium]|nr:type II secretion system protein GspL [Myxococcales bacterium]
MARILGIDIEHHSLRGAIIRTSFRRAEVERYIYVPVPDSASGEQRDAQLREAVAELTKRLERPVDIVTAGIDGQAVSLRQISLPAAAAKRVGEVLPFELEALLPFDIDDAVVDYQPAGKRDGELELLVAAIVKPRLREELDRLTGAGIQARHIVPSAVGLEGLGALDPEPEANADQPGPQLLIELRRDTTEICITVNNRCKLARTLSVGADGLPDAGEALVRGVQQTLASYRAAGGPPPERCILMGEGSFSDGMERWLSERLQLPVAKAELPPAISGGEGDAGFGRAFSMAARLARPGKHINLRTGEFAPSETRGALVQQANLLATCAIAVLITVMFAMWSRQERLLDEQESLTKQLAQTTKAVFGRSATTTTAARKLMKSPGRGDPLPRFDAFDALSVLSASVAPEVKHDVRRLRIEVADDKREGTLELQGSLATIEQRDAIISKLGEHPCFADIEPGRTSPARGQDGINYQLEATVQCPGDVGGKKKKKKKKKK